MDFEYLRAPSHLGIVEITFSWRGDTCTMWVNIDGVCRLRVVNPEAITCDGLPLVRKLGPE